VSISRTDVLIGDSIRYQLVVNARKGVSVEMPDLTASFTGFFVRNNKKTVEDSWGRRIYRYIYIIAKDEPGDFEIPPLVIRHKGKEEASWHEYKVRGFKIKVRGLLGEDDRSEEKIRIGSDLIGRGGGSGEGVESERSMTVDAAFRYKIKDAADPKDILTAQDIIFFAVTGLAVAVFLIAVAMFVYDRLFRKKTPPIPIDIAALDRLEKLERGRSGETIGPKDFCFSLSRTVKDYLKALFKMEEREKTTSEFISELSGAKGLYDKDRDSAREILMICDLVKYSDYSSNAAELSKAAAMAKDIVLNTRTVLPSGPRQNI